jgi:hypothetical protein
MISLSQGEIDDAPTSKRLMPASHKPILNQHHLKWQQLRHNNNASFLQIFLFIFGLGMIISQLIDLHIHI